MQPKYLESGSTNSIKLAKFFDKVIINKIIIQHYLLILLKLNLCKAIEYKLINQYRIDHLKTPIDLKSTTVAMPPASSSSSYFISSDKYSLLRHQFDNKSKLK